MTEAFKTIILLSVFGSIYVITLYLLMLFFRKRVSGNVQKLLWIVALIPMIFPVWRLFPVGNLNNQAVLDDIYDDAFTEEISTQYHVSDDENSESGNGVTHYIYLLSYVWFIGVILFILLNIICYILFTVKMLKSSRAEESTLFEAVKLNMNIRRKIPLRKCGDIRSPFLAGVFFPVIYVPVNLTEKVEERFVYLHELTHYRHKDLMIKWIACLVNALHWFNPLCYVITKNINKACELSCDSSVIKHLTNEEKKMYMKTILNLMKKEEE